MQFNSTETKDFKELEYKNVVDRGECTDLEILYHITFDYVTGGDAYVLKYENNGLIFKLWLDVDTHGNVHVTLTTDKYGFADLGGMNVFAYTSHLKKMLNCLSKHNTEVKKLFFEHVGSYITAGHIDIILEYLKKKNLFKNGQEYEPEDLPDEFLKASAADNGLTNEQQKLKNYFLKINSNYEFKRKVEDESQEKRFNLFLLGIKRMFKGINVKIDESFKPNFTVTFS